MTSLSVRGLTVLRGRRTVLEDVSFSASAGAVTTILAGAGAGKTTLLAAIAGLLPVERGAVVCGASDVTSFPPRRRGIGFLAPGSALPGGRSVAHAVGRLAGRGTKEDAAGLLASLSPILAERSPTQLSHGESLLALAAARLLQPGDIVLIDEACMGLDEAGRAGLVSHLRRVAQSGRTVILATRCPGIARQGDQLVLLAGGQVIQAGTPASVYAEPRSEAAARLTGDANIFAGRIRELRPQGFIWTGGGRFLQAAEPDMPRPTLGAEVTLCLRPERIALLATHESADNMLDAEITDVRSAGPLLNVCTRTQLGDVLVASPSWRPIFYPAAGQHIRIAWAPDAGWVLP